MKKFLLSILFCEWLSTISFSQQSTNLPPLRIDSLQRSIQKNEKDTNNANHLIALSVEYRNISRYDTQYGCWTGTYTISGGGNCCALSPVGIEEFSVDQISVSPNPSNGEFQVAGSKHRNIEVCNVLGEKVFSDKIVNSTSYIAHLDSPKGIYLLKISDGNSMVTKKIVVE